MVKNFLENVCNRAITDLTIGASAAFLRNGRGNDIYSYIGDTQVK